FQGTGRSEAEITALKSYFKAQGMYGVPNAEDINYTQLLTLDLSSVTPSLAGPKRPQDRIELGDVKATFTRLFSEQSTSGFNLPPEKLQQTRVTSAGTQVCWSFSGGRLKPDVD